MLTKNSVFISENEYNLIVYKQKKRKEKLSENHLCAFGKLEKPIWMRTANAFLIQY